MIALRFRGNSCTGEVFWGLSLREVDYWLHVGTYLRTLVMVVFG